MKIGEDLDHFLAFVITSLEIKIGSEKFLYYRQKVCVGGENLWHAKKVPKGKPMVGDRN